MSLLMFELLYPLYRCPTVARSAQKAIITETCGTQTPRICGSVSRYDQTENTHLLNCNEPKWKRVMRRIRIWEETILLFLTFSFHYCRSFRSTSTSSEPRRPEPRWVHLHGQPDPHKVLPHPQQRLSHHPRETQLRTAQRTGRWVGHTLQERNVQQNRVKFKNTKPKSWL